MKTRKQGNSIVINVPAEFNIKENVEYIAIRDPEDELVITYIPKIDNPFAEALKNGQKIDVGEGFPDDAPVGKEMF